MKIYEITYNETVPSFFKNDFMIFDIETTGLSPKTSFITMIGMLLYHEKKWKIIQIFNDDGESEQDVIQSFFSYISNNTILIHYNGTRFDLPFLIERCEYHTIHSDVMNNTTSVDLSKVFSPLKDLFQLKNKKLSTLLKFSNKKKKTDISGRKYVQLYLVYLKLQDDEILQDLLAHNYDDLDGIVFLCQWFTLLEELKQSTQEQFYFEIKKEQLHCSFSLKTAFFQDFTIIKEIDNCNLNYKISCDTNQLFIEFPLYFGEQKFFYPNYKDYYYLPMEDMAIHKSVATYVDKEYRQKATAKNCYIKKKGIFLPLFEPISTSIFYENSDKKIPYILFDKDFGEKYGKEWVRQLFEEIQFPQFPEM